MVILRDLSDYQLDVRSQNKEIPFFETVIRYLGGLLSAYALSHNPYLLSQADELGARLLHAFTTPTGLPDFAVNTYL
jgi:mannosyl-oligosaccharide alpha-1,2-mannosidase